MRMHGAIREREAAAGACPGCGHPGASRCAAIPVARIAAAWARWEGARGGSPTRAAARVHADLRAEEAAFLRCASCGVERAEPPRRWRAEHAPPPERTLAWDHLAALERLRREPPRRLLALGCAEGAFLVLAADLGHRGTGVDPSPAAVARARGRGVDAHAADLARLPETLRGERFQAVALFRAVERVVDPADLLAVVGACAAPGALLLVGCPAPLRYTRRVPHPERLADAEFWDWPPHHLHRWTPEGLRALLARHGWRVEAVEEEPYLPADAAAHLAALSAGVRGGEGRRALRAGGRAAAVGYRAALAAARLRGRITGSRMLAVARRESG